MKLLDKFAEFSQTPDGECKPIATISQDVSRLTKIHKSVGLGLLGFTNTDRIREFWFESPLLKNHKPKSKQCGIDSLIRFYRFLR